MLEKSKRWESRKYLNWIATLSCANCGIIDETIVPHHAIDICYTCHSKLHNGDKHILTYQPFYIFDTLDKAFKCGIIGTMEDFAGDY
jgi:hypothetical protein